ncbi:urease accessory protein UreF [Plantactinospora sp. S1510]|uniref:Urease accessory protein UreF n=1 Tax=Plantactinospora alkalitolerans TaxID=2789879 RepID=A0ABS0H2I1_9ACTN|nr:urease accessory UreF family protein [Plantactinospora alkalitolerans]MBF9132658.1 urease accessory protein UreF [Plantactinospora alkalitolerans]
MTGLATLLVLADGRLPAGGHAHSGGLEAAVSSGRLRDLAGLSGFLRGRLATTGRITAAFAAAACVAARTVRAADADADADADAGHDDALDRHRLDALDEGLDARTPSPALRRASRVQGRALLRAGRAIWSVDPAQRDRHHPVALGIVAAAAGLPPAEAAVAGAYGTVSGPASAAVRLLGLDPYGVHSLLAELAGECDRLAALAAARAGDPIDLLPADSAPLLEIGAEVHANWEVRLFAS